MKTNSKKPLKKASAKTNFDLLEIKQNSRIISLQTSLGINSEKANLTPSDILKDAEEIYKYLISDLK